ncbi:MAG: ABC transporter permease [Nocardioides sp.]
MTATTPVVTPVENTTARRADRAVERPALAPIPLSTVVSVELRKMFDTRSGFWLMASIGILSVLATGAVIIFAPDSELTYATFAAAIGFPTSVVLPMIAILSVTSEWSQRSGLTTFTLVPHRGRVVLAKGLCAVGIGVVSMAVAMAIGAGGNVLGSAIAGVPTAWDMSVGGLLYIVGANVLGLTGFTLGVLIRNSAGAIVGYFVYALLLPTLTGLLATTQEWFSDLQPWVSFQWNQQSLFEGGFTGEQWAQLVLTGLLWLVLPMAFGVWRVLRSEVK